MARYQVKAPYSEKECLPCAIHGQGVVNLLGKDFHRVVPASILGPEKKVKIPGATQAQLKALYDSGNKLIEKVEKPAKETSDDK